MTKVLALPVQCIYCAGNPAPYVVESLEQRIKEGRDERSDDGANPVDPVVAGELCRDDGRSE